jgi:hypothetical protein
VLKSAANALMNAKKWLQCKQFYKCLKNAATAPFAKVATVGHFVKNLSTVK